MSTPFPTAIQQAGTADLVQTYTPSAARGAVIVGWPLTPWGDRQTVTGPALALQRVQRFFYAPFGTDPFNPSYGSKLWDALLSPMPGTMAPYLSIVVGDQAAFLALQAREASLGFLDATELVEQFLDTTVTPAGPAPRSAIIVFMQLVTQAGIVIPAQATVGGGTP